jgi:hypothetical protein
MAAPDRTYTLTWHDRKGAAEQVVDSCTLATAAAALDEHASPGARPPDGWAEWLARMRIGALRDAPRDDGGVLTVVRQKDGPVIAV